MKEFLSGLFHYISEFIMSIPFHAIRNIYLGSILGAYSKDSRISRNVDIRSPKRISIGKHTSINKNVVLDGRGGFLRIGDNVDIAQDSKIWTLQHDYNSPYYEAKGGNTCIEDYVWIASGATILPGITVGKGSVIATGAIVTRNVEPYSIMAGIPAKKIGERNRDLRYKCGKKRWFD